MIVNKQTKIYVGDSRIKKVKQGEEQIYPLGQIFGVRRQISSSSPAWERLEDGVGLVANATHDGTPVRNDFDELYPWSDIISYNYDISNDRIMAYYGDSNFKFDGSNGQVLTKIPEFWWKRYQKDGWEYIYISTAEEEGFQYSKEFSVARFLMNISGNQINSISGVSPSHTALATARQKVQTASSKLCLLDYHYFLIQLLYLVEYANYDSQTVLGKGSCNSKVGVVGGCNSLGMKSGCLQDDGSHSVSYRGMEDLYGYYFQTLDGMKGQNNGTVAISYNPEEYGDYNKYHSLSTEYCTGYWYVISQLTYDSNYPEIQLPSEVVAGGSMSTYACDAFYGWSGNFAVQVGGSWLYHNYCGLWCIAIVNNLSSSYEDMGYRFIKY